MISVETGLKLVPVGEISRKTFKLEEGQVFMFDAFCWFKVRENNNVNKNRGRKQDINLYSLYILQKM